MAKQRVASESHATIWPEFLRDRQMTSVLVENISSLTVSQKSSLKKGGIVTLSDLLLAVPADLSRTCRIPPLEIQRIVDAACERNLHHPPLVKEVGQEGAELFTTGDKHIDEALGGGIRTGMVWEVVGESSAGKSQMAHQLCLTVQLTPSMGGVSGSACYFTVASKLQTTRLVELIENHPSLSPDHCSLSDIQTIATESPLKLLHVLSRVLPDAIDSRSKDRHTKPVKLVVIDAIAELFHTSNKNSTSTLVDRARFIVDIAAQLHTLAAKYQVAFLIINEVTDVFTGPSANRENSLVYTDQTRWHAQSDGIAGESRKQASLGLVWANQVNVRIMISRTGRRRRLDDDILGSTSKHRRISTQSGMPSSTPLLSSPNEEQYTLIRRMSVLFSSVSNPVSLDYIVTLSGVFAIPKSHIISANNPSKSNPAPQNTMPPPSIPSTGRLSPMAEGCLLGVEPPVEEDGERSVDIFPDIGDKDDDFDEYWKDDDGIEEAYASAEMDELLLLHVDDSTFLPSSKVTEKHSEEHP